MNYECEDISVPEVVVKMLDVISFLSRKKHDEILLEMCLEKLVDVSLSAQNEILRHQEST